MRNQLINIRTHRRVTARDHSLKASGQCRATSDNSLHLMQRSKVAVGIASMCFASGLLAAPVGPQVVHGSASFIQQDGHLEISNSNGTIINWQDFSIASQESVNFLQTHASSAILNRVISNIPTDILGELTSNGRVFVINPNGLVIGKHATIDTAGFVASALNIADNDFLAGRMKFVGDSGEIENHGYIAVAPGGEVVLIAPSIENHGVIEAPDGSILLAAGREVVLHSMQGGGLSYKVSAPGDRALNIGQLVASNGSVKVFAEQIFQTGAISANRVSRTADGSIVLEADSGLSVSGELSAQGQNTHGGDIHLLGEQVDVTEADINASGEGGGEVLIGGDYQGKGSVSNAENTSIDSATIIRADGGNNGDGGRVIVWSDNTTNSFAKITARGGSNSGAGGFVETSGKKTLDFGHPADVSASNGAAGTWLLDPEDIVIDQEHADSISASLSGGSNVEVRTSDAGNGEGNIEVNAPITKSDGDQAVSLTLDAHNRVDVNAPITTTAGPLNLTIKTGREVVAASPNEATPIPGTDNASELSGSEEPQDTVTDGSEVAIESSEADSSDPEENTDPQADENTDEVAVEVADSTAEGDTDGNTDLSPGIETLAESEVETDEVGGTGVETTEVVNGEKVEDPLENEVLAEIDAGASEVVAPAADADMTAVAEATEATEAAEAAEVAEAAEAAEVAEVAEVAEAAEVAEVAEAAEVAEVAEVAEAVEVTEVAELTEAIEVAEASEESSDDGRVFEPEVASELDNFIDESAQQIVIAADIFTGGGELVIDSGINGDTIIAADIISSDQSGATAGDITITGQHIAIVDDSSIEASAEEAGEILIGGGQQGQDAEIENSEVVIITQGSNLAADGGLNGDGGRVIVFSEQASIISGNLSARGGSQSGNGGFIETSGLATLRVDSAPDTGAGNGAGGEWLIDPYTITISDVASNSGITPVLVDGIVNPPGDLDPWNAVATGSGATISTDVLGMALSYGDVTIDTRTEGSSGEGNINFIGDLNDFTTSILISDVTIPIGAETFRQTIVTHETTFNDAFERTRIIDRDSYGVISDGYVDMNALDRAPASSLLTLNAFGNINFSGSITAPTYSLSIDFNAGQGITFSSPGAIIHVGGSVTLDAELGAIDLQVGSLVSSSSNITINADQGITAAGIINSSAGSVTLTSGVIAVPIPNPDLKDSGLDVVASTGSDVIISGNIYGATGVMIDSSRDIRLDSNVSISTPNTPVSLNANRDINLYGNVFTLGGGAIDLTANTGRSYTGNLFNGTAVNSGDGYGVVNIQNLGFNQFIDSPDGVINIQGAGLTIESSACAGSGCTSGISLYATDINLGTAASQITGDIVISSTASAEIYGGGNIVYASHDLRIATLADLTVSNLSGSEEVSLISGRLTDIEVRDNLTLVGTPTGDPLHATTFSSSIVTYGDLSIDVGGALTLDSGEILLETVESYSYGLYGESGLSVAADTITVNNLYSHNGLIAFNRDQNAANGGNYAPGELIFTTNGADSHIFGVENPIGPYDYGLALRSVTWVQNGEISWDSGSIELTQADVNFLEFNPEIVNDSKITNNGMFAVNSESGDFIFENGPGIGTFYNPGTVIKDSGVGTTVFEVNLDNSGSFLAYSGTIHLGTGGFDQSAGETILRNGNISVDMESAGLNFSGGELSGGANDSYPSGGTLTGNVTAANTTISPGISPGTLTIDGNFDASAGGNIFNFDIDLNTQEYDELIITGDATITGNNTVNAVLTGYFPADIAISSSYSVISVSGTGTISSLPTSHSVADTTVVAGEATDGASSFDLIYTRAATPPPPLLETNTLTPPVTVTPPPPPTVEPDPEVIVIIIDDVPLALPPDIVKVILSLTEEQREAYLESERVRKVISSVNQCSGNV